MTMRKTLILAVLVCGLVSAGVGTARAEFVAIADFNDLELGPIAGQNGWYAADPTSVVALDPALSGLKVLTVETESTILYHAAVVPEDATRMLFTRFRYEDQLSVSFGLTQDSRPDRFGEFDVELSLTSTRDDLRINDDGTYQVLTALQPGHWYNIWLLVDNDTQETMVWMHDRAYEGATAADQLSIDGRTSFPFRGTVYGDIESFYIKTGGGDGVSGPLVLDDIYLQDDEGIDLSNPVNVVSAVTGPVAAIPTLDAWPNPFNPQITLSFTLTESQPVALSVHDVSGRLVRKLMSNVSEVGTHAVVWDGRDRAGTSVASGVYFAQLSGRTAPQIKKLVLVR